ncbi:unnamed protein product [Phytomonas sp. EM1]|nr:unnamed protein product [Phytomonas sp. EM1]|eukprot:CCW59988.1 unnamed protein product [Phytomonas sp. isolate EM1]
MSYSRCASHSAPEGNGWYDASPIALKQFIGSLFNEASRSSHLTRSPNNVIHGLISPHAGISYSGKTASAVYSKLYDYLYGGGNQTKRIFIMGPSHHKGFNGAEVSHASAYETPFGPVSVDITTAAAVLGKFSQAGIPANWTTKQVDEEEHSIEMQLPFISYILHFPQGQAQAAAVSRVSIVPIIIGWTDRGLEERMSDALQEYLNDPSNVFILSSDFCHWGSRFRYTYHYQRDTYPNIGEAIIALDHRAISLLHNKDIDGWYDYLEQTNNTICGRNPIGIGLNAWVNKLASKVTVDFVSYSQSNKCQNAKDSSVSYASALIYS